MPIDNEYRREFEEEELVEPEYIVNPYTIQYDTRTQSFFKGFAPKIAGFGGLAAASAVVALTAGIGVAGVAGIALTSVAGVGALTSGYFSLGYALDYRKCSKRTLKNTKGATPRNIIQDTSIDIQSKKLVENVLGVITFVKSKEAEAAKYVTALKTLKSNSKLKRINIDGDLYSKSELKKHIKGYTRLAYKGTKYLMQAAAEMSEVVEKYRVKGSLTPKEEGKKFARWYLLNQIGECVKQISSKREDYNPYKGLIIDSLHKGCLIGGSDYANNQIRDVVAINDRRETTKLYFEMYEREMLEEIQNRKPKPPTREERLEAENARLRREKDSLQNDYENAADVAYEASKMADRNQKKYEGAVKRGLKLRTTKIEQERLIKSLVEKHNLLNEKSDKLFRE